MDREVPPVRTALVLGGSSEIGLAIVRRLARDGLSDVVLAVRRPASVAVDLLPLARDHVHVVAWDAHEVGAAEAVVAAAVERLGHVDLVLCTVGSLGHHSGVAMAAPDADRLMRTNYSAPAVALLVAGRALAAQGRGTLVVLSSVAGARSRRSNFVYGSAKAGLDAFAQGLRDALVDDGVRVLVVRPGFVRDRMTAGLDPAPFASTPEQVAEAVARAVARPGDRPVWVPALLGPLLGVLRTVPAPLWRRIAGDR